MRMATYSTPTCQDCKYREMSVWQYLLYSDMTVILLVGLVCPALLLLTLAGKTDERSPNCLDVGR